MIAKNAVFSWTTPLCIAGLSRLVPVLAAVFRRRKHPFGKSWRMDETYIKVAGEWKYLYRAAGRAGDTVDFLLTAKRDLAAARRFLEHAINLHDVPEKGSFKVIRHLRPKFACTQCHTVTQALAPSRPIDRKSVV